MTEADTASGEERNVPQPREHEVGNGDLAVSSHWVWGIKDATIVPAADRDLYRLLMDVLGDVWVPDTMPARLARACEDLVDVRDRVTDIERGSVDIGGRGWGMGYCYRVRDAIDAHRDRQPLTLAAVGCSGSKHEDDGLLPARDRYKRAYWVCKRRYGDVVADDWQIISAEYGLLDPDQPIPYYERTPEDLRGVPVDSDQRLPTGEPVRTLLDRWALDVHEALAQWLDDVAGGLDPRDVELEVLVGRRYKEPLEERGVFDRLRAPASLSVVWPFQEVEQAQGGNGNQMGWLSDMVDAAAATDGGEAA